MSKDFKKYLNFYTFKCVLPGSGKEIEFKPITTGELKKLLIYENENKQDVIENALDQLIASCVINKDFDIDDLFLQDRFYLLFEIRKRTKGETYKFEFKCPECGSQNVQTINLNDLNVRKMNLDIDNIVKIDENISVRMSNIIRGAQKEVYKSLPKENNSEYMANLSISTIACGVSGIITPDGEDNDINIEDKIYFIENIPTGAYEKISNWYKENDFGVDFTYNIKCKKCGYEYKDSLPLSDFFL
jgi:rubredoxin